MSEAAVSFSDERRGDGLTLFVAYLKLFPEAAARIEDVEAWVNAVAGVMLQEIRVRLKAEVMRKRAEHESGAPVKEFENDG